MNLPRFITAVDSELEKMSEQELKSCVRELARTLPEKDRAHFLSIIVNSDGIIKHDGDDETSLKKEVEDILSVLDKIDEGERCLDSEYNEEWDDWYNSYDGNALGVKDLYEHELIVGSFDNLVAESLYLTYMAKESKDRASEIFTIMGNYHCDNLRLEDVMQLGNHSLPDFNIFLSDWITLLGTHNVF